MSINRRKFIVGAAGTCGGLAAAAIAGLHPSRLLARSAGLQASDPLGQIPTPSQSGIEHIVVVTMENRSFDHLLGWLPGSNGKQAGLHYKDASGAVHNTYRLAPDFTGCPHPDPDHSYTGARIEYDNAKMDGFLLDTANDKFCIGYYTSADIPFYAALAKNYTTLSGYFCSILGPTFPNRLFLHAAQTDRLDDSVTPTTLPTIWDELSAAGISSKYYFNNVPFLALWGTKYLSISYPYVDFLLDAFLGNLPAVSFIDPIYTVLDDGTGNDDHPHADIRRGDAFLSQTFQAIAQSPNWNSTVLIINFDEWGGFFEHVPPPRAAAPNSVDPDIVDGKTLLGCRVPTVIASPFTRGAPSKPRVIDTVFDHTSALKLIEWRWGLSPLTARDASSDIGNILTALNLTSPNTKVPALPHPNSPPPKPCVTLLEAGNAGSAGTEFGRLAQSDLIRGWNLK